MENKLLRLGLFLSLVAGLCLFGFAENSQAQSAEQENHCFTCHTNARKLIQIIREIEESRKDQPKAEIKSEGEG
jgi:hypothetical protein